MAWKPQGYGSYDPRPATIAQSLSLRTGEYFRRCGMQSLNPVKHMFRILPPPARAEGLWRRVIRWGFGMQSPETCQTHVRHLCSNCAGVPPDRCTKSSSARKASYDRHDVPRAGRLLLRLLRVAHPATLGESRSGSGLADTHPQHPRAEPRDV